MSALRATRLARSTLRQPSISLHVPQFSCARRSFARSAIVAARKVQSVSPLAPIGVEAALKAAADPTFKPRPTLQKEFSLTGRVAIVSGANRGLGLEMTESLCEAGAIVYALDTCPEPGSEWKATQSYVERMGVEGARLEYASVDVTDQKTLWNTVETIASKEGRMDVCIAAAAILHGETCLDYKADDFNRVMNVNATGVLHTAQAAGRMMAKYGTPGSIILIASMSGGITNRGHDWVAYNASKAAVHQMGRSLACELGPQKIRVNTISPGHFYTAMTAEYLDVYPELLESWSNLNPLGRLGRPDELRGAVSWLASDASSFCTGSDILVTGGHHAW